MCGIGGVLRLDGGPIPDEWLDAMFERLDHRGPDGAGRFSDHAKLSGGGRASIAFVHARLAIIDPLCGAQPMVISGAGHAASQQAASDEIDVNLAAVVFNGCIYNHRDLRRQLVSRGHSFRTDHSDTEVLLHGHRDGPPLPDRLDGMFAYAIWDRAQGSLTLARDRAGEKPLYLWVDNASRPRIVVFASAVPAVLAALRRIPGAAPSLDDGAWRAALVDGFPLDATPFAGLQQVPPATEITIDAAGIRERRYWSPPRRAAAAEDGGLTIDSLDDLLRESVSLRLDSDAPLGCFLSGGVDSSLIASHAQKESGGGLQTFCVRMPDPRYDESRHAEAVAAHLGVDHTTLDVEAKPADDLIRLIEQLGLPFGDSSILPTFWVSRAARAHVKAALSGDGGDELFLGYDRYRAARALEQRRSMLRLVPATRLTRFHPRSQLHKLGRLAMAARCDGYADLLRAFPTPLATRFGLDGASALTPVQSLADALSLDFNTYLPGDLLRKVDTASMAVALEVRAPFLSPAIMERALRTPISVLMPRGQRKGLLRQLARRYLPPSIVDRPKMGFAIPVGEWLRDERHELHALARDALHSRDPFGALPLDTAPARAIWNEHVSGRRDHSQRLFGLLTLAIWARTFLR